ncbi:MAG: nitrogen regulation protein NR(I) [Gammaproteobacteria bacterium]|nr:nitrogen regulation protein NR(I) [Gammaproteobacteria bacterium]
MTNNEKVWVIDDDRSIRWVLEKALSGAGMDVSCFEDSSTILDRLSGEQPDVIISDIRMPGMDGIELLEKINYEYPEIPVIIITAHSDLDSALSAYQGGAFEYLPKPFDIDEAVVLVQRAFKQRNKSLQKQGTALDAKQEIIGEAPAMQEVFRAIGRLSRSNITVMITGESGTGKELVAQALHRHSPRANEPFIAINTAAIPRDLLESELFGHERGAFTGAQAQRKGRFEQADGGTLFLDEIGDMPAELQTRLLRVLADGEFYRVGGHAPIKVDVRIIAATHQNLSQRVQEGQFRDDLFHRLNVIRIQLPALRERSEDIPKLIQHFLASVARELGVENKSIRSEVINYLQQLEWPGNVRQLENTCRWLTVMASGREIHMEDLPPELLAEAGSVRQGGANWEDALEQWVNLRLGSGESDILSAATPAFERILIKVALKHTGGRKQDAAKLLGWGRNTLTRKLKELDMNGVA